MTSARKSVKSVGNAISVLLCGVFFVQNLSAGQAEDAYEFFREEANVVTASRREQPIQESPVAIDVITRQEIDASGAMNLWDLLRFRVGMDVSDTQTISNNRAIVSVRGFPVEFVNGLQVLVDGRSVFTAFSGGVYWQQIPVQLQDVQQIEIVRGPNAALYGANAALGVVNIITKKPDRDTYAMAAMAGGSKDFFHANESANTHFKDVSMSVSHTYLSDDGFVDSAGKDTNSHLLSQKLNSRANWDCGKFNFDASAGAAWEDSGNIGGVGDQNFRNHFQMLRSVLTLSPRSAIETMLSRSDFDVSNSFRDYQYDGEVLHRFSWWRERAHTAYGASYRDQNSTSLAIYGPSNAQVRNQMIRGFANQSLQITPKTMVIGAASLEDSDSGKTQPAYQAAAIHQALPGHYFRLSYSLASSVPTLAERYGNVVVAGVPTVVFLGNANTESAKLSSYEIGYRGNYLAKKLSVENNYFYITQKDLTLRSSSFIPPSTVQLNVVNDNDAIARGTELEFRYRLSRGEVYSNYTYEYITDRAGNADIIGSTPRDKLNLGGTMLWGKAGSFHADFGYKDGYTVSALSGSVIDIPAYWRIDAKVGYKIQRWELYVLGQNLAEPHHQEFQGIGEIPRRFIAGVSTSFGGR